MTKHFTRSVAAAAITAISGSHGASAAAASGTDVEQAMAALSAVYAGPNPYGVFKSRDRKVLSRLLTPALVETWAGPEADGPEADASPIAWSQMTDSVKLNAVSARDFSGDRGTLDATVDAVVEGNHVTKRITWDMRKVGGRWLGDDLHTGGLSFRTMFAGFAPAKASVPPKAAPQAVSDRLPLRHGIFVLRDVPCQERSNATVQSFWGDALNTSHETGSTLSVNHQGNIYKVGFTFQDIEGGPRIVAQRTIVIRSPSAYVTTGPDGRHTEMRWCATAM